MKIKLRNCLFYTLSILVLTTGCQNRISKEDTLQNLAFRYVDNQFQVARFDGMLLGSFSPKRHAYEHAVLSWHPISQYVVLEEEVGADSPPGVSVGHINKNQFQELRFEPYLAKLRAASPMLLGLDPIFLGFDAKGFPIFSLGRERLKIGTSGVVSEEQGVVNKPLRQTIDMRWGNGRKGSAVSD